MSMSMEPPPPAYAYVFRNRRLPRPPLQKQGDDTDVSELHAKYWGVSINQEESEWVDVHGELVENDLDGSEVVRGCFTLDFPSHGGPHDSGSVRTTCGSMTVVTVTVTMPWTRRPCCPLPS